MTPIARFESMPVYKNPHVALQQTVLDTDGNPILDEHGNEKLTDVLFWKVGRSAFVHPDRWDRFVAMMSEVEKRQAERR